MTSSSWPPIVATSPTLRPSSARASGDTWETEPFAACRLVLADDSKRLAAAVVTFEGDAAAELHGIDFGLHLDELRAGAARRVIAQVARRDRHCGAVGADVATLRRLVGRPRAAANAASSAARPAGVTRF